jgi:hypothetical protein
MEIGKAVNSSLILVGVEIYHSNILPAQFINAVSSAEHNE